MAKPRPFLGEQYCLGDVGGGGEISEHLNGEADGRVDRESNRVSDHDAAGRSDLRGLAKLTGHAALSADAGAGIVVGCVHDRHDGVVEVVERDSGRVEVEPIRRGEQP